MGVTPRHELAPASFEPAARWGERISLEGFARGVYELRVVATAGSAKAERRVSFLVE
jgi:hypothetical protein